MRTMHLSWSALLLAGLLNGCGGSSDESTPEGGGTEPETSPVTTQLAPIAIERPLIAGQPASLALAAALPQGAQLTSANLISGDESCDVAPAVDGNRMSVQPTAGSGLAVCHYEMRMDLVKQQAKADLSLMVSDSGDVMAPLFPLSLAGVVGQTLNITLEGTDTLAPEYIVFGAEKTAVTVDTDTRTISYIPAEAGVARVLYSLSNAVGDVQLGSIDFTVSEPAVLAPSAKPGEMLVAAGATVTIDLSAFVHKGQSTPVSLVANVGADGVLGNAEGLVLSQVLAPVAVAAGIEDGLKLRVTVPALGGVYPVRYTVRHADGGYASNVLYLQVHGPFGVALAPQQYDIQASAEPRSLILDVAALAQTSSGMSNLTLVEGSLTLSHQSTEGGLNGSVSALGGTKLEYRYGGNSAKGQSVLRYQVFDSISGIKGKGVVVINIGSVLPVITSIKPTFLGATEKGLHYRFDATCSDCDLSATRWTWSYAGDVIHRGVGQQSEFVIPETSCFETGYSVSAKPVKASASVQLEGQQADVKDFHTSGIKAEIVCTDPECGVREVTLDDGTTMELVAGPGVADFTVRLSGCSRGKLRLFSARGYDRQNQRSNAQKVLFREPGQALGAGSADLTLAGGLDVPPEVLFTSNHMNAVGDYSRGGYRYDVNVVTDDGDVVLQQEVILLSPTSPDTPLANRWGNRWDYLEAGGFYYFRPMLYEEQIAHGYTARVNRVEQHENYGMDAHGARENYCPNIPDGLFGLNYEKRYTAWKGDVIRLMDANILPAGEDFFTFAGWTGIHWIKESDVATGAGIVFKPHDKSVSVDGIRFLDRVYQPHYIYTTSICVARKIE